MRRILVPSLLVGSMLFPVAAVAHQTKADASLSTATYRVSTGVIAPVVLETGQITVPQGETLETIPGDGQVGLTLTVDRNGLPRNIQVLKGLDPSWDASVVEAVEQFRFRPATMDNEPIAVPLNLTVTIAR